MSEKEIMVKTRAEETPRDRLLDFFHKYISVSDRIRSTKKWLPTDYRGKPFVINPGYAKLKEIVQLDDIRFVHDTTVGPVFAGFWVLLGVFTLVFMIYPAGDMLLTLLGQIGTQEFTDELGYSLWFLAFSAAGFFIPLPAILLAFVYPFKLPKQRLLIFDRETGMVTLPPRFWGEHDVIPFKELKVKKIRNLGSWVQFHVLGAFRPSDGQPIELSIVGNPLKDWAFFCWYMDKTRPLPPSVVFDPYRERDEERRRRELAAQGLWEGPSTKMTPGIQKTSLEKHQAPPPPTEEEKKSWAYIEGRGDFERF